MAAKNDSKKTTTKTAKAKKGDASPAKNSKKPKAPKAAAPETAKVPEPVSPPPVTAPAATEGEVMDGHTVHEALKHVLNACPKADGPDGNPALAFVLLDRDTLLATDDFAHHKAFLPQPASTGPVKITRASLRGLQKKLDGELKSGAETSTAVTVVWSGLIVEVHGVGETHHVTLLKFDGGPDPKHLHLAASPVGDGVRVPLELLRRVKWRGEGSVLVYTDPATGRVCLDAMAGPATIYRATLAAASLGIRQPSLPGVSASPPQAPAAPAPGPTEPPAEAVPVPEVPRAAFPSGLDWVLITVPKAAFAELLRRGVEALANLPPWSVNEELQRVDRGPVPRGAILDRVSLRLAELGMPYSTHPAGGPPSVYTLASGATEPVRAALPDVVDAEFEEAKPPFEDPAPGVAGDVLRVTAATWEAFDADATERLIAPLEMARVVWEDRGAYHVTEPVTPRVALALEKVLRELGCVELDGGLRPGGGEVRTFALSKARA